MDTRNFIPAITLIFAISAHASQSIPHPTPLQSLALQPEVQITWSEEIARIESADTIAVVTAIEVENPKDETLTRGVLVELESEDNADQFFVDRTYLRQFMNELVKLEPSISTDHQDRPCEASHSCIGGIARCRPSQHIPQAFCPEMRIFVAGGTALILRTPKNYFEFPEVLPSALLAALYQASERLSEQSDEWETATDD